jgi:quercetin dioxygenase-like cupin family protein
MARHETVTDEIRDQSAMYALGLLESGPAGEFAEHLREGCPVCESEVRAFTEVSAQLAFAAVVEPPPPSLRKRLLEEIQPLPPGMRGTRASEGKWMQTPYPGISIKFLYQHPKTKEVTQLVRFEPGARLPPHHHTADERCLVVKGDVSMGKSVVHAGDFVWAEAGSEHQVITSEKGCVLLIVASPKDEYSPL